MTETAWRADGPAPLSVNVSQSDQPGVLLAMVNGEMDYGNTHRLAAALGDAPGTGTHIVLDLSGLTFCDSSALGALVALHKRTTAAGGRLFLVHLRPQVADAIAVTSLDQLLRVRESVETVLAETDRA